MQKCSICQRDFTEFGNNAEPVNSGRCCNECDWVVVIPARLRRAPGSLGGVEVMNSIKEQSRKMMEKKDV